MPSTLATRGRVTHGPCWRRATPREGRAAVQAVRSSRRQKIFLRTIHIFRKFPKLFWKFWDTSAQFRCIFLYVTSTIHCVELKPGKGAQIARSAGTGVQYVAREGGYATLRLRSGEIRKVPIECRATIGEVGNKSHEQVVSGKAGRSRWLGKRPTVRGVVMNPVDHPHGGGEGKSSGGRHPVTPWGKPTKGYKTRKKNKKSNDYIVKRRK